ncbi:biotin-dependent carboxyltransferase family protein [Cognatishimia sp. SS12]|uniref:5-oxoprolinase subunit C family protein n=1 Tax=Cognatishimia sp. SS12 TaxID=2979465 RepID=UPI00232BAC7E|nr:biotin-dependent carboxyltransferase family protein [Cognatishimia sp. SS12]MDC0738905.1 biotin-dependent carboxyltransferase family protein [Cognatishimia sp. SS12]
MTSLTIHSAGPAMSVQDLGRSGLLDAGISRGGAADRLAIFEGAALLRQSPELPVIEMMGMGGAFSVNTDCRIALTGAPMRAVADGQELTWNASHLLSAGTRLSIGGCRMGSYGYLHLGGGVDGPRALGSAATHLSAGIGKVLAAGDTLPIGPDGGQGTGELLAQDDRFEGGTIRIVASFQTALFSEQEQARFAATHFKRDARANRMGVRLTPPEGGFAPPDGRNVLSEVIMPGDIQITGDGTPFVLMSECQTIGGYPRIGTVLPCDLPRVAQTPAGGSLRFAFVSLEEAVALERAEAARRKDLRSQLRPLIRDPHRMSNLLSYNLISGMIAGDEFE